MHCASRILFLNHSNLIGLVNVLVNHVTPKAKFYLIGKTIGIKIDCVLAI